MRYHKDHPEKLDLDYEIVLKLKSYADSLSNVCDDYLEYTKGKDPKNMDLEEAEHLFKQVINHPDVRDLVTDKYKKAIENKIGELEYFLEEKSDNNDVSDSLIDQTAAEIEILEEVLENVEQLAVNY